MTSKKLKIAITGNIGSGKSTFSRFIQEAGYKVINADELSKSILANNENVKDKVVKAFGKEAYSGGIPNKKFLSRIIFNDAKNLSRLESILHPVVIEKSVEMMESQLRKDDIVFLEAALIYEADMEKYFDYVILITANRETRFQRKKKSENYSEEQFVEREEMQIPEDEKRKRADFIFSNDSDLAALQQKVNLLFVMLQQPKPKKNS